jgi:hypothetical protein
MDSRAPTNRLAGNLKLTRFDGGHFEHASCDVFREGSRVHGPEDAPKWLLRSFVILRTSST